MLKRDRKAFDSFVSGDMVAIADAVSYFHALPLGHFEDHPVSRPLVRSNLKPLVDLWHDNPCPGCREWVLQFIADAETYDVSVHPVIEYALKDENCECLPTVLYLMSRHPDAFTASGELLAPLASHADREVRWRVAFFISRLNVLDAAMRRVIDLLSNDRDETTQTYVAQCRERCNNDRG